MIFLLSRQCKRGGSIYVKHDAGKISLTGPTFHHHANLILSAPSVIVNPLSSARLRIPHDRIPTLPLRRCICSGTGRRTRGRSRRRYARAVADRVSRSKTKHPNPRRRKLAGVLFWSLPVAPPTQRKPPLP